MPHSILYIDDSGTKEYVRSLGQYSNSGNTRYFCFGGLLIENKYSSVLGEQISDCKYKLFGERNVEIKSNWLRIPKEKKARYLNKYGISDSDLTEFVESLYDILSKTELMLIAVVVDKAHMQEKYGHKAWYAPTISYETLMQRAVQEVSYPNTLSVVIDDMTGATPKGNQYKKNLKKHHESLRKNGSPLIKGLDFQSLLGLRFVDSASSHHIQLADIVAYNVYRQFVEYGGDWEDTKKDTLALYPWFEKLSDKFRQKDGRIQGYGIVKVPLRKRIKWSLK